MRRNKAFGLTELLSSVIIGTILIITVGNTFYLHGKHLKDLTNRCEKNLNAQLALQHILQNISNSAWMKVTDTSIELYSHSMPHLRTYSYSEGKLIYKEGSGDPVTLAEELNLPESNKMFSPLGPSRPTDRFNGVEIELLENSSGTPSSRDIFRVKEPAYCQESWDIIYVDPSYYDNPEHDILKADGTKLRPFSTLDDALNSVYGVSLLGPLNIDRPGAVIYVLSGDHVVSGSVVIPDGAYLFFASGSSLTIEPGAAVRMGEDVRLFMRGELQCLGTAEHITALSYETSHSGSNLWAIYIGNGQTDLGFSNLDISGGLGIWINSYNFMPEESVSYSVTISDIFARDNQYVFTIAGAQNIQIYNNTFENNYLTSYTNVRIFNDPYSYYAPLENLNYSIHHNTFRDAYYYSCEQVFGIESSISLDSSKILTYDVYNNLFQYCQPWNWGLRHYFAGEGVINGSIYNNMITSINANGLGTLQVNDNSTNAASQYDIHHNTIKAGIVIVYSVPKSTIRNNKLIGVVFEEPGAALGARLFASGKDCVIRNNFFRSYHGSVDVIIANDFYWGAGPINMAIANNIISNPYWPSAGTYGNVYIGCAEDGSIITFVNNTLDESLFEPYQVDVRNCVIWGMKTYQYAYFVIRTGGTDTLDRIWYSDIANIQPNQDQHLFSQEPPFTDYANHNYHLDLNGMSEEEKNKWLGSDGTEIGAYGGPEPFDDDDLGAPETGVGDQT